MSDRPLFLMTDPSAFEVSYRINPWMRPDAWKANAAERLAEAGSAFAALRRALTELGSQVETIGAVRGLPDLVFPANAAVVLDGRALMARFRHPERQGEEAVFRDAFRRLQGRGVLREVVDLPEGALQEGAGDAIWDARRRLFWAGYGPRSAKSSLAAIEQTFGETVVGLELASDRYYHLDTCFCPLAGGEVLYYPAAFTPAALAAIRARVPEASRIEATDEAAEAFCVNAVNLGDSIVMARAPASLKARLSARGYRVTEVDLAPFILSGGGAYCMTLRLDRESRPAGTILAAE
ncbi:MAG TPA: arginine deiminase-related protein [Phenylobacterium sp.]|uniref:dimethylarginine dimethylaminohydrolase family protein n=1 Tax=Phenylobacterium sp. TaxID=1871053 RepID=UPI002B5162BE|nr:arginine deiminase-related protein [Phenylobacterium sp.]HSV02885.1 arginine deiminase-related protein [Phenylobacterium sp.]